MARYLTSTGTFDLSAIMVGAWKDSEAARRMCGLGNHPAIIAERRRRFATFLKRAWQSAKLEKSRFDVEAARLAAEAARRAAIPDDERARRIVSLRDALAMNEFNDGHDYLARRAAIVSEINRLAA